MAKRPNKPLKKLTKNPRFILASFIVTVIGIIVGLLTLWPASDPMPDHNLSGRWLLSHSVTVSEYASYQGMEIEFEIQFIRSDSELHGQGEKISVNGVPLPLTERTPIFLDGSIAGDHVTGSLREHGQKREPIGSFSWTISKNQNIMKGSFKTSAGNSQGQSIATRQ